MSAAEYTAASSAPQTDFRKLFPLVQPSENVVSEYQCSLSRRKLLRVGRLYVTPVRLCFYSMLVDPVNIAWSDIENCEKKSQVLFDQIIITPQDKTQFGGELCFTGFMNGASSPFNTIKMLWGVGRKYASNRSASEGPVHPVNDAAHPPPAAKDTTPNLTPRTSPEATPPSTPSPPRDTTAEPSSTRSPMKRSSTAVDVNATVHDVVNVSIVDAPPEKSDAAPLYKAAPSSVRDLSNAEHPPPAPSSSAKVTAVDAAVVDPPQGRSVTPPESSHADTASPIAQHKRSKSEEIALSLQVAHQSHLETIKSFPNVPRTESLLETFQCSYVSGVHRIGKMHITTNYVLFYSVMLTEPVVIKIVDIASVEKSVTMLLLEGLALTLKDGKRHEFTSFISRERAFALISQLLSTHEQVARTLGLPTVAAGARTDGAASPPNEDSVALRSITVTTDSSSLPALNDGLSAGAGDSVEQPEKEKNILNTETADSTAALESLPNITSIEEFDALVPTSFGNGLSRPSLFLDTPVSNDYAYPPGYSLFDVFHGVYDDNGPVLRQYREARRETELQWRPWQPPVGGPRRGVVPPLCGERVFKCNTIIRALLVEKMYPYEEFQRYGFCTIQGVPHLIYQTSGQASGVTFADTFRAETLCVYREAVDPVSSLPRVVSRMYLHIQFIKFSIVKGKIRSASTHELKEGMAMLNQMTKEYLMKQPPRTKSTTAAARPLGVRCLTNSSSITPSVPLVTEHSSSSLRTIIEPTPTSTSSRDNADLQQNNGGHMLQLPSSSILRAPVLAIMGLAALYGFSGVWSLWWHAAPTLVVEFKPALDGGLTDVSALHTAHALGWLASFVYHVVRPLLLSLILFGGGVGLSSILRSIEL